MTERADAIVIGAGIVGCASAWQMAQRGLKVVVLEREAAPATGSTGRSAAGVRHQFSDEVNVALSMASIADYRAMPQAAYQPIGYLFYVPDEAWDAQMAGVAMQRRRGAQVEVLDLAQATRRVPAALHGLRGATWCADDGVVDPHGICLEYARRARECGARLRLSSPARHIEGSDAGWTVHTTSGRVTAPRLVNAAGAWAGQVGAMAGRRVPVQPARRMVFATGPLDASLRLAHPYPLTVDLASGVWFRSERDRLIYGLANPADTGFEEGIDWTWLEPAWTAAAERFPWFASVTLDRRASWWGYYEVTPDHNGIVGMAADAPGWIDACGFSGHGVQQAAAVGRVVGELACGEAPFIDVGALAVERFGTGPGDGKGPGDSAGAAERLVV